MSDVGDVINWEVSSGPVAAAGDWHDSHPAWCSAEHCYLNENEDWVYTQTPVYWKYEAESALVETRLIDPPGCAGVYLKLCATTPKSQSGYICYTMMPVAVARQLCDQLTAHLDAAEG